jgi:hypothetical protein
LTYSAARTAYSLLLWYQFVVSEFSFSGVDEHGPWDLLKLIILEQDESEPGEIDLFFQMVQGWLSNRAFEGSGGETQSRIGQ